MSASRRDVLLAGTAAAVAGHAWAQSIGSVGPAGTVGPVIGPTAGGGVSIPTVAGDPLVGGASFGQHNNFYLTSSGDASTKAMATAIGAGGSSGVAISLQLPTTGLTIPAEPNSTTGPTGVGDWWMFIRTKTPASDTNTTGTALQALLGVAGDGSTTASPGGSLSMQSLQTYTTAEGTSGTGWAVDPTKAGQLYAARQGLGSWQWFQGSQGLQANLFVLPSTTYGVCVGIQYQTAVQQPTGGAGSYGATLLATLGGSTPQSAIASAPSTGTWPTSSLLFNLLGASGLPAGIINGNYTGELSDCWVVVGATYPTAAQIQSVTNGQATLESVVVANGGSAANIYHCDLDVTKQGTGGASSGVIPADTNFTSLSTTGVTINNFNGATLVAAPCGPHRYQAQAASLTPVLQLNREGPWKVWPLVGGATSGTVWLLGSGVAGAQVEANLDYLDGGSTGWSTIGTIPISGNFIFSLPAIAWKRNFFRCIGLVGDTSTRIFEKDTHSVGYVFPHHSQSEGVVLETSAAVVGANVATATASAGSTGGALNVSSVTGTIAIGQELVGGLPGTIVLTGSGTAWTIWPLQAITSGTSLSFRAFTDQSPGAGHSLLPPNLGIPQVGSNPNQPFASNVELFSGSTDGYGYFLGQGILPEQSLVTGGGNPGDGNMAMINACLAAGVSVMTVNLRRSGSTKDTEIWCNYPWTYPSAISGTGPWTFTLNVTTAMAVARATAAGITGASNVVVNGTFRQNIKAGTVTITLSDGTVITDNNAATGGTPYAVGGLQVSTAGSPGGGATLNTAIASSFVNYVTASNQAKVSVTLASNPNNATIVSVTWESGQQIVDTTSAQKTTQINNYGVWEAFNAKCVATLGPGRTGDVGDWISSELGEAGQSVQAMAYDQNVKWQFIRQMLAAYAYPGVNAALVNPPLMLCPKGRDTGYYAGVIGNADIGRASEQALWSAGVTPSGGGLYAQSYCLPMPWFYHGSVEAAVDPHPAWDFNGGRRIGELCGAGILAGASATPLPTFSWGAPIFGTGLNGYATNQVAIPIIDNSTGSPINAATYSVNPDVLNGGAFNTGQTDWFIGQTITSGVLNITAITKATNAQVTVPAHGLIVGQTIFISGVVGMTQINSLINPAVVVSVVDVNNFTVNVNSSSYTAYSSGGTLSSINGASNGAGKPVDNNTYATLSADTQHMIITLVTGVFAGTEVIRYIVGAPGPQGVNASFLSPYQSQYQPNFNYTFISGGSIPAFPSSSGLPMPPLFYNSDVYP